MARRTAILSGVILALIAGCDSPSPVIPTPVPQPPGGGGPPVFVGAGDIAQCHTGHSEGTAKLLDAIPGTVFTLGDNAYFTGSREDYRNCYGPTWGRHRARTRPVPGNHEYESPGAIPYFEYYGPAAGPFGQGFYSFDIGPWHLIALNSNIDVGESSEQVRWLREDLRSSRARCTLAFWHHPLFSSGPNGNMRPMQTIWRILMEESADVVLTAHDHLYERFGPQDPARRGEATLVLVDLHGAHAIAPLPELDDLGLLRVQEQIGGRRGRGRWRRMGRRGEDERRDAEPARPPHGL